MRFGRWSELSVDRVCQEYEVMREVDANETSGELGSAFGGTLVGLPHAVEYTIVISVDCVVHFFSLVSVVLLEYHDGWCALKSPRIRASGVARRCYIED